MESFEIAGFVVLLGFYIFSLFQRRLSKTILTLPMLMTFFGLLLASPLSGIQEAGQAEGFKRFLAETTLVLVLFSDASSIRIKLFEKIWQIPLRMLLIGMPLSIIFGTALTYWLFPAGGLLLAILIASVLAPTDAALAQPVVKNEDLPPTLTESLNVESGLNDGLAVPFVFGAAALLAGQNLNHPGLTVLLMICVAPIAGYLVGYTTARLLDWAHSHRYSGRTSAAVVYILTPFLAYLLSELLGGNGFIAAFVGGMAFGNTVKQPVESITSFMESEGQILTMLSFFVFGAYIMPTAFEYLTFTHLILALLFVSVIRMLPVYISLWGTGLSTNDKLFLGWFGPRGLASILYTLLIADGYEFPHKEVALSIISLTVLVSIILHGISANPIAKSIASRAKLSNAKS